MAAPIFAFNAEKSLQLKEERGISFEEIVALIEGGWVLDVVEHPNQAKYPGQRMYVMDVGGYVYLVPFVRDASAIFLKTIYPSRKATQQYLGE